MKIVKFLLIYAVAFPLSVSAQDTDRNAESREQQGVASTWKGGSQLENARNGETWQEQIAREAQEGQNDFVDVRSINFRGGRNYAANAGNFFHGMAVKHPHNQELGSPDYYIAKGWTAENALAAQQTGFQQLGNGFLKGVVMVVEIPLGCVGLVMGIVCGMVNDDFASGFNSCPLWGVMEDIYDWTDWVFPIYHSKDYEEGTVIGKFFTCTFWAEVLTYIVPLLILMIILVLVFWDW